MTKRDELRGNGRMKLNKDGFTGVEDIVAFLQQRAQWHRWYFQYLTGKNFKRQLINKKIWFTRSTDMNDRDEARRLPMNKFYFCMSYGMSENVAMWTTYGIPRKDAIRVSYDGKAFRDFVRKLTELRVVNSEGTELKDRISKDDFDVSFHDVVYLNKSQTRFHYKGESYRLNKDDLRKLRTKYGDYYKKFGWQYEYETRVVITLPKKKLSPDAYALTADFSKVQEASSKLMGRTRKGCLINPSFVIVGPWSGDAEKKEVAGLCRKIANGAKQPDVRLSDYYGELKPKSACDRCKKRITCKCREYR